MRHSFLEVSVGVIVVAVAVGFLAYASGRVDSSNTGDGSYDLLAKFRQANGVLTGTDVRLSGVKVGSVSAVELEQTAPERINAVATLTIRADIELPTGTNAKVVSDGLLGGAYISLEPACDAFAIDGDCPVFAPGDEIIYTTGSVDLLTLLGSLAGGQ